MDKEEIKNEKQKLSLDILFLLTFISIFASTFVSSALVGNNVFLINKYTFIHFIFLIIPIINIIVSIIFYKKDKSTTRRNILLSLVVMLLLVLLGTNKTNYNPDDYNKIFEYKDILDIELPSEGNLMIVENDNVKDLYALYNDRDGEYIFNQIKENDNWLSADDLKSELTIFLNPLFTSGDKDNYFLIYNMTTEEYNKLPSKSGEYKIASIIYSKAKKSIEIDTFIYKYIS